MSLDIPASLAALELLPDSPFPRQALESIIAHRDEMTPHLLDLLVQARTNPEAFIDQPKEILPFYATYLLASFHETRAYRPLVDLLSLDHETVYKLFGDAVTEEMPRLLADVHDGDLTPLHTLIENPSADEYVRDCGIGCLGTLHLRGQIPLEELQRYFAELYDHRLEREPSHIWESLVNYSASLGMVELLPRMRQPHVTELASLMPEDWDYFETIIHTNTRPTGPDRWNQPIPDVVAHLEQWHSTDPDDDINWDIDGIDWDDDELDLEDSGIDTCHDPYFDIRNLPGMPVTAEPKIGRNEPCPCGSGLKHKKCCGKAG